MAFRTIEGFNWDDRQEPVSEMIENGEAELETAERGSHRNQNIARAELVERISVLEGQVRSSAGPFSDPELTHKIVHACMTSDQITEEEELRILKAIVEHYNTE